MNRIERSLNDKRLKDLNYMDQQMSGSMGKSHLQMHTKYSVRGDPYKPSRHQDSHHISLPVSANVKQFHSAASSTARLSISRTGKVKTKISSTQKNPADKVKAELNCMM